MKVLKRLKQILIFDMSSGDNIRIVREQIMEENRKYVIVWASVLMLFWAFSLFMSTKNADYMTCRHIYSVAFAMDAVALLLAIFAARKVPWLTRILGVLVDASFLGAGVGIAVYLAPKTIVIFASAVIIPVLFISDTMSTILIILADIAAFVAVGQGSMDPETFRWTLTNMIIFSFGGTVVGFFVNKARFERFVFAESAVQLAEMQNRYAHYDKMTGVMNRLSYSEKIEELSKEDHVSYCVIMVDINGLKRANDTFGHRAGDELIVGAAECLCQCFDAGSIYRIGGDEFCVILENPDKTVEEYMDQAKNVCAGWKGEYGSGISLSLGFASSGEYDDIEELLKAADKRMYEFKRHYYEALGIDRRRR